MLKGADGVGRRSRSQELIVLEYATHTSIICAGSPEIFWQHALLWASYRL